MLAAFLLLPRLGTRPSLGSLPEFFRFSVFAVGLAPAVSAILAALAMYWLVAADFSGILVHWYLADALGMAIVTPIGLGLLRGDLMVLSRNRRILPVFAGLLFIQVVAVSIFYQTTHPYLFFIPPALMFTAAVFGFEIIPLAMIVLTANALTGTLAGHGPFNLVTTEVFSHKVIDVQLFVLLNFMMSTYVANASDQIRRAGKELKEKNFRLAQSEKLLLASESRFRMLSENSADMVFRLSESGIINYASPSIKENLGWAVGDVIGRCSVDFTHPEDVHLNALHAENLSQVTGPVTDQLRILHKNGHSIWVERKTRRVKWEEGVVLISNLRDITKKKMAQEALAEANKKLNELATVDGLTGLKNRRYLDEAIATEWSRAERGDKPVSFMLLDVDRFKLYNDNYGHQAGDECLQRIAASVAKFSRRTGDCAARYGGEEMALLLPECDEATAAIIAEELRLEVKNLQIPHVGNSECGGMVTVSIGVSTAHPANQDKSEIQAVLIKRADELLYEAKRTGRNRVMAAMPDAGA